MSNWRKTTENLLIELSMIRNFQCCDDEICIIQNANDVLKAIDKILVKYCKLLKNRREIKK